MVFILWLDLAKKSVLVTWIKEKPENLRYCLTGAYHAQTTMEYYI